MPKQNPKQTYCAFLRGVNVNGRTMKMADICAIFQHSGMKNVSSIRASGNIIFSSELLPSELNPALEQELSNYYQSEINLFLKNAEEIDTLIAAVPYEQNPNLHIYVFICESGFETVLADEFQKITPTEQEKAMIANNFFYWQTTKGATLQSGFSKILGRATMKNKFTSRNIETIIKIRDNIHKINQ